MKTLSIVFFLSGINYVMCKDCLDMYRGVKKERASSQVKQRPPSLTPSSDETQGPEICSASDAPCLCILNIINILSSFIMCVFTLL